MKPLSLLVLSLVLLVSRNAHAADEAAFKDVSLGLSLAQFTKTFDHSVDGDPRRAPAVSFGSVFSGGTKPSGRSQRSLGMVTATKTFAFEDRGKPTGTNDTVAGVPADVSYWFFADTADTWDNAAKPYAESGARDMVDTKTWNDWDETQWQSATKILLGTIRVRFAPENFVTVTSALEAKYGPPRSAEHTIDGRVVTWAVGPDDRIVAQENRSRMSVIEYVRESVKRRAATFFKEASAANATDL